MKKIVMVVLVMIIIYSCNDSSSKNSTYELSGTNYEQGNTSGSDEQMYACPMCGGTGIFEVMPGDVMAPKQICQGCGGNKFVTAEQAQNIMETKKQVDAIMGGNNGTSGNSSRSAYEIEYDLRKAYDLLESMENDYQNCSSGVMKAQYPNMIADQKALINRLENELRNAQ